MLVPGTIIIFDELINYHGWEEGEFKAFMEFTADRKLAFEYVAYNRTGGQVAVRSSSDGACQHAVVIADEPSGWRAIPGCLIRSHAGPRRPNSDRRARRHHGTGRARRGVGAAKKKSAPAEPAVRGRSCFRGNLVPVDERHADHHAGLPSRPGSRRTARRSRSSAPTGRSKIPRGSSTYIPPPDPSPYSREQPAGRGADPARARSPTSRRRSPPSAIA